MSFHGQNRQLLMDRPQLSSFRRDMRASLLFSPSDCSLQDSAEGQTEVLPLLFCCTPKRRKVRGEQR